jgi:hypothetical protein
MTAAVDLRVIQIGRNTADYAANAYSVDDEAISRKHVEARLLDEQTVELKDLGSTNGTYVNDSRIPVGKPVRISPKDAVTLAKPDLVLNIFEDVFGIRAKTSIKTDPNDFTEEFKELKSVYNRYKNQVKKLKKNQQTKMAVIRTAIAFIPAMATFALPPELRQYGALMTASAVSLGSFLQLGNSKYEEALEDLNEDIRITYKCPGKRQNGEPCTRSFSISDRPTLLEKQGKCLACNAVYVKN